MPLTVRVSSSTRVPRHHGTVRTTPPLISVQNGDIFFSRGGGGDPVKERSTIIPSPAIPYKHDVVTPNIYSCPKRFDTITTFNAAQFQQLRQSKDMSSVTKRILLRRYNSHESTVFDAATPPLSNKSTNSMSSNNTIEHSHVMTGTTVSTGSAGRTHRPEFELRDFLERYSLPRVVKIVHDGRPLLLYKFLDDYVNLVAKGLSMKKKKDQQVCETEMLYFPEMYQGWFSLTNDRSLGTAVAYTSIVQLVQEQVCTFLCTSSLTGYVVNTNENDTSGGYVRCTREPGVVYTLRGIFQHNPRENHSQPVDRGRDLANRYAQLIDSKRQELFVPLTAKGCFYEIGTARVKTPMPGQAKDPSRNPLFIDKDCIYRLSYLLKKCSLPLTVKLIAGPLPQSFRKNNIDTFKIENKINESVLIACLLPTNTEETYQMKYMNYETEIRFSRTLLGFDSENRLLKSSRLQNAFTFCRTNGDLFCSRVRTQDEWNEFQVLLKNHNFQPLNNSESNQSTLNGSHRPLTRLKWLQKLRIPTPLSRGDSLKDTSVEVGEKLRSLDRYKDMSKLIEDKFGRHQSNPVRKSASFMFASKRDLERTNPEENDVFNGVENKTNSIEKKFVEVKVEGNRVENVKNQRNSVQPDLIPCDDRLSSNSLSNLQKNRESHRFLNSSHDSVALNESYRLKNSFITDRLCSEFHVKTKNVSKPRKATVTSRNIKVERVVNVAEEPSPIEKLQSRALPVIEDLPYARALDSLETPLSSSKSVIENIYVEIADVKPKMCGCGQRQVNGASKCSKCNTEYAYVKLDPNSDDAIYSTLR